MKVGVVDIGTNSMRLLISDGGRALGRWVVVTGLGHGVDRTGRLDEDAIERTLVVLRRFGELMDDAGVARRLAIATSASRDASNRGALFDRAAEALGTRPRLIDGGTEAAYAYAGAVSGGRLAFSGPFPEPFVVSDIGGGSTEFVSSTRSISVDIGSVRLTDRVLEDRPANPSQMASAGELVKRLFAGVDLGPIGTLVGVAGTWTSIAAIAKDLPSYDETAVHGQVLTRADVEELVEMLAGLSIGETAAIPAMDPDRAPVILAGVVIARGVIDALGVDELVVSCQDTLDGAAIELAAIP